MAKGNYIFRQTESNKFVIEILLEANNNKFNFLFNKSLKKLKDKEAKEKIKGMELNQFNIKNLIPENMKVLIEGQFRSTIKKTLNGISSRSGLIFRNWYLYDAIYTKNIITNKWDIKFIFKGDCGKK